MKRCVNCGAPLTENDEICPRCGEIIQNHPSDHPYAFHITLSIVLIICIAFMFYLKNSKVGTIASYLKKDSSNPFKIETFYDYYNNGQYIDAYYYINAYDTEYDVDETLGFRFAMGEYIRIRELGNSYLRNVDMYYSDPIEYMATNISLFYSDYKQYDVPEAIKADLENYLMVYFDLSKEDIQLLPTMSSGNITSLLKVKVNDYE